MQTPASPIPLRAACLTDLGRARHNNEDHCFLDLDQRLFLVSDGMGGHHAGDVASEAVALLLPRLLLQQARREQTWTPHRREQVVQEVVLELSQQVQRESAGRPGLQGMGATLALAWIEQSSACLAHLGDSRIYLLRQDQLTQLTEDHSLLALLVQRGEVTPEEARTHPARGRITRYVGMAEATPPDVQTISLHPHDRLLLCTDGLTDMLPDPEITRLLQAQDEPKAACQALIAAANAAGGSDNITALVVNWGL